MSPDNIEKVKALLEGPPGGLCYVAYGYAWFTTAPITGEGKQWGDDWDDAPYEHNAGAPYRKPGVTLTAVKYNCGTLETPADTVRTRGFSVDYINANRIPWLRTRMFEVKEPFIKVYPGDDFATFSAAIALADGDVYVERPVELLSALLRDNKEDELRKTLVEVRELIAQYPSFGLSGAGQGTFVGDCVKKALAKIYATLGPPNA